MGEHFSPYSGMTPYVGNPIVSFTLATLFIVGGIGFAVLVELAYYRSFRRLSLHTKLVLSTTGILIVLGMLGVLLIEWGNPSTLGPLSIGDRIIASFFQGVTPRTAGFNTLDLTGTYPATQFLLIILMFIGASPSSTGGGIKTTTFSAILLAVWGMIRGQQEVVAFRRTIPHEPIYKALTVSMHKRAALKRLLLPIFSLV